MGEFNPKELEFCQDQCSPHGMCLDCVPGVIKATPEGRKLVDNPLRWSRFMWDDTEKFLELMGKDADPLHHGIYQAREIAIPMIEMQNTLGERSFTREEAKMLVLGHAFHDAHEGIVGDIPYPDKAGNRAHAEMELAYNLEVVAKMLHLEPGDDFMKDYEAVVGDLDGSTFLGRAFDAGEKAGYFLTGIRAWSMRNHTDLKPGEREKAADLGREVCGNHGNILAAYSKEFVYCDYLLSAHESTLKEMA